VLFFRLQCDLFGRGDRIRTCDLYVPNVALYQTELHPEGAAYDNGDSAALQVVSPVANPAEGWVPVRPSGGFFNKKNLKNVAVFQASFTTFLVGETGFEPATSTSRT
jgi:hypothetical protein